MKTKKELMQDAQAIEDLMKPYTGADGAHFAFIVQSDGQRHFCIGGRVDLGGFCLSEALANLVRITPGLDEGYIDIVCDTAKDILREGEKGVKQ